MDHLLVSCGRHLRRSALFLCAVALLCCSTDDPSDPHDARPPKEARVDTIDSSPDDDGTSSDDLGGTSFDDHLRLACKRLIGQCQQQTNPLNQPWKAVFDPWSEASCQKYVDCMAKQTGENCIDRVVTYFVCLAKEESFTCQSCQNAYQFIWGACPCLKECDASCL